MPDPAGAEAEARNELRAVARELLAKSGAPSRDLLATSGWTGLEVPEAFGGAGATFAETAVICGELGRAAARSPYLGAVVLGAGTLLALEACPGRDALLRGAASGDVLSVAVLADGEDPADGAGADGRDAPFRLEPAADGQPRLHGLASFAPDVASADRLLLLARSPARSDNSKRLVIAEVAPDAAGISVEAQPVLDETRRLGAVRAEGAPVDAASVREFAGDPALAVRRLLDRAAVAVACDSLGVAEAMLDATVAYAKAREQFGRPVGSFQAVQHACADMLVAVRASRELVTAAVTAVAAGEPGSWAEASMAKSHASAAAVDVAGKAMQLHGGIGYTWESGIHAYLKRAMLNRSMFGAPEAHRRRLATRYSDAYPGHAG